MRLWSHRRSPSGAFGPTVLRIVRSPAAESSVWRTVAVFAGASVTALAILLVGGFYVLRGIAIDEAKRVARERAELVGVGVVEPMLTDGMLSGSAQARAPLDRLVAGALKQSGSIVRVKIWSRDGEILYSDQPKLIGERYELEAKERWIFTNGGVQADLSDLTKPENRYERSDRQLLEVYLRIRTPSGRPVLWEQYERFSSLDASASQLLRKLAGPLVAAALVLLAVQIPLAWAMAERLRRSQRERERLLLGAIEASANERRRIAAELHDGVVQDLAGVTFGLAAEAEGAPSLTTAVDRLRACLRGLRSLLVEIHPANLQASGLRSALVDLAAPLTAGGVETTLEIDEPIPLRAETEALLYRTAREALRNVAVHSEATRVSISLGAHDGRARLVIDDDGRGFTPAELAARRQDGHVGLALVEELAAHAGGSLAIDSRPGSGTRLTLEVPLP
jgi:two-component system, NarL family, sensor kinase